jgi:catechol 2,3-dioxygenase-like lactoylglutathione lyase family enzyme
MGFSIAFIDVNVLNISETVDFYGTFLDIYPIAGGDELTVSLDAKTTVIRLHKVEARGEVSQWIPDDLQQGFRHIGFAVSDIEARFAKIEAAGTKIHLEIINAHGGVRICFFYDPNGVLLELIEGKISYDKEWTAQLVNTLAARSAPVLPIFDHVALTTANQNETIALYGELGFQVAGQLFQKNDPRGFEITYLHSRETVLEIFNWTVNLLSGPGIQNLATAGYRSIGFKGNLPTEFVDKVKLVSPNTYSDSSNFITTSEA